MFQCRGKYKLSVVLSSLLLFDSCAMSNIAFCFCRYSESCRRMRGRMNSRFRFLFLMNVMGLQQELQYETCCRLLAMPLLVGF
jgi:hypothetical protein